MVADCANDTVSCMSHWHNLMNALAYLGQILVKRRELAVPWHISLSHTVHDREICLFFLKGYVGVELCPS